MPCTRPPSRRRPKRPSAPIWTAPAKTPRAIIDRLNKEIHAAVALPDLKQRLQDLGVDARASSPEGLRDLLVSETAKWKAVVEKAKIEKQ